VSEVTGGEVGGYIAGATGLVGVISTAVWRIVTWRERRLRAWEESLDKAAAKMRQELAEEVQELRAATHQMSSEIGHLRGAVLDMMIELKEHSPNSPALRRAEYLLRGAFPVDPNLPPDIANLAARLDN